MIFAGYTQAVKIQFKIDLKSSLSNFFYRWIRASASFIQVHSALVQCCVLTNSSPLGVGQAPVENSWGTYKTKNVAQKKLA